MNALEFLHQKKKSGVESIKLVLQGRNPNQCESDLRNSGLGLVHLRLRTAVNALGW
jgi:hypothetical protein